MNVPNLPSATPAEGSSAHHEEPKSNYFLIFVFRQNSETLNHFLVQNLIRECVFVYGIAQFQCWENPVSFCVRFASSQLQLETFIGMAKETMRIFGCNPDDISVCKSDFPQRA